MPESLPSQQIIAVDQVRDGIIILKNGGLRKILLTSGLNFELMSQEEQEFLIRGFQQLLFSLEFSIQCVIHSRKIDIEPYIKSIEEKLEKETEELLRIQAEEYIKFIRALVDIYGVIEKKFFIVVPYDPILTTPSEISGALGSIIKKRQPSKAIIQYSPQDFEKYKIQLENRVEQVRMGLERLGIRTIPLNTEEVIELLYNLYNPSAAEKPYIIEENSQ
jgi:type IV secretory pathway VirB4 component